MRQCDNSYDTPNSSYLSPTYASEPLSGNQSPDFDSKPILDNTNCRQQRKRDPLPQLLYRCRTTPPQSFVEISDALPLNDSQLHGFHSPHPPSISHTVGTEAVISLAWTGELSFPIVASGRAPSRIGAMLMYKLLEKTFMQWCEVVGEFFIIDKVKVFRPLVKRTNGASATFNISNEPKKPATLAKRVGSWSKKRYSRLSTIDNITSMVTGNAKGKAQNKTPIQDLAILPTQRITRYVLLFKEFMINSPLSIRPTTERAAEAAMTLAQKADNAQGHVAFQLQASRA